MARRKSADGAWNARDQGRPDIHTPRLRMADGMKPLPPLRRARRRIRADGIGDAGRKSALRMLYVAHDHRAPHRNRRSGHDRPLRRSEEHTSELQSLMRISYAVFCLKKNK